MKRAWCWFCWKTCNDWWPFSTWPRDHGAARVYWWLLPWSGEYVLFVTGKDRE